LIAIKLNCILIESVHASNNDMFQAVSHNFLVITAYWHPSSQYQKHTT